MRLLLPGWTDYIPVTKEALVSGEIVRQRLADVVVGILTLRVFTLCQLRCRRSSGRCGGRVLRRRVLRLLRLKLLDGLRQDHGVLLGSLNPGLAPALRREP